LCPVQVYLSLFYRIFQLILAFSGNPWDFENIFSAGDSRQMQPVLNMKLYKIGKGFNRVPDPEGIIHHLLLRLKMVVQWR
jgi:hypothetical protein